MQPTNYNLLCFGSRERELTQELTRNIYMYFEHRNRHASCMHLCTLIYLDCFSHSCAYYTNILDKINRGKSDCIYDNFNVNLLKCIEYGSTREFLQTMCTYGFYLLISKPTRITRGAATIIVDIPTHLMITKIVKYGLQMKSVTTFQFSLQFAMVEYRKKERKLSKVIREVVAHDLQNIETELSSMNWETVTNEMK